MQSNLYVDGTHVAVFDVHGDGNCLFHSLLASKLFPFSTTQAFRAALYHFMSSSSDAGGLKLATRVFEMFRDTKRNLPFQSWLKGITKDGTWAGSAVMIMTAVMSNVR